MTDDSPSSSTPGAAGDPAASPPPPVVEPDRTVMRPSDPQPPPGAIDNGDGPVSAGPTPPGAGAHDAPRPAPPTGVATGAPDAGQPASPFPGGFHGDPPYDGGPVEPEFPTRASRAGVTGAVVAIGTGLLGAAVAISAIRSRSDGELDWSNFTVGLGAAAVLLVIALVGAVAARRVGGRAREEVVTWPGVVGILATAVMIVVAIDKDDDWVAYLVGGVMVALAAIGYLAARRAAFVVVAIAGLGLIYLVAIDDVLPDSLGEDHPMVLVATLIATFVVVITLLGWLLPTRAVTGVVVGVVGVVGLTGVMVSFVVARYLGEFFGGMMAFDDMGMDGSDMPMDGSDPLMGGAGSGFAEADIWWVLVVAAILVVLWALAASITNHSGFTILAIALTAILVPMASVALAVEQPTWWAAILAAGGGVLLLGAAWLARRRGRSVAQEV